MRDETGRRLHQGDLSAGVAEDRGELTAGVGAADHRDRRRQLDQVAESVEGERELGAGNRNRPLIEAGAAEPLGFDLGEVGAELTSL